MLYALIVGFLSAKNPPRRIAFQRGGHGWIVPLTCYTPEWKAWRKGGSEGEAPERYMRVDVWAWDGLGDALAQFIANDQREVLVEGFWGQPREYEGRTTYQFAASRLSPVLWEKEIGY